MPVSDKAKNTGKFIVIMLCFAIIFFLLLPFLEDPAAVAAAQSKKATPQIFTSNPLTELARKIYSLFGPRYRKAGVMAAAQGRYANAYAQDDWPDGYTEEFLTADTRYSDAHTEEGTAGSGNGGATVYFPEAYDFGEAGFVNEAGEWVLIRQTAPETAQRGMHDINSSDTAYDRFVRLERSAKYAVPNANTAEQIPPSKWAQLFNPINNLLGLGETEIPSAVSSPAGLRLASADGMDNGGPRRPTERFARRPGLDMPANFPSSGVAGGNNQVAFDLLNPFTGIEDSVANLKETASKTLTKDQQNSFNKYLDQQKAQTLLSMRQQVINDLIEDAKEEEPKELVSATRLCSGDSSGFYKQRDDLCSMPPVIPDNQQRNLLNKEAQQNQLESRKIIDAKISELTGTKYQSQKPIDMLVLLSKTKAGENPMELISAEEDDPSLQSFQEFYNYMYTQQGCDQQDCYWIGVEYQPDPSLRHTIQSSGMEYLPDPLGIHNQMIRDFQNYKIQTMEEDDPLDFLNIFDKHTIYYVPYTKENMDSINQRNNPTASGGAPKKPEEPFVVYVPSAANTLDAQEVLPNPYWVIYDDKQSLILDQNNPDATTPKERGAQIRDLYIKRLEYGAELNKEKKQEIEARGATELLRLSADKVKEQLRQTAADRQLDSLI